MPAMTLVKAAPSETLMDQEIEAAVAGDRNALERIIRHVQDGVYNLSMRMLWHPEDAADATQEILLKMTTHLATFRHQSAFRTWVYRIAVNHLLNVRRSRVERENLSFERFAADLATGSSDPPLSETEPERALLVEEVRIGCTQGMLLCLDRPHRLAYVLGEIFEFSGSDAAAILEITEETYRQRLSRARVRIRQFMQGHCGLINSDRPCRCERRLAYAIDTGRVRTRTLLFAGKGPPLRDPFVRRSVRQIEDMQRVAALYRSHPEYSAPERIRDAIRSVLDSGEYSVFN